MNANLAEALIGAIVLVVAGLFLNYAYARTSFTSSDTIELVARFNRADGIGVGTDVRISGVKVGTVKSHRLETDFYQAVVVMSVATEYPVPADGTVAKITSDGLLGGNYIDISIGYGDEPMRDGDEFEQTQGSVDLFGLIAQQLN